MSKGVNKAIILGRVGKDPERVQSKGSEVARIVVATSEKWLDKRTNENKEKTEWHKITAFGRTADLILKYVNKGAQVYIEGRIQTEKWQDNNGQDRYSTGIIAQNIQFLDSKKDNRSDQHQEVASSVAITHDDMDDDIPF